MNVTQEWVYKPAGLKVDPCVDVRARLSTKPEIQRRMPLRLHTLAGVLDPQPGTAEVLHALLEWIGRCDAASQCCQPPPPPTRMDGAPLFPEGEWWLTELEKRRPAATEINATDEVAYDDDEVTNNAEEAWWHDSGSDSSSSCDGDSDASLTQGPHLKTCTGHRKMTAHTVVHTVATGGV